ncbi:MAG: hypothetical protein TU36_005555 [Vulcanisaeta sp. AZ3]|jgi:uncharacterized coiled-coil protein SlyX
MTSNNEELKGKLLELLKVDEEFRLAVMGLLGIANLSSSIDKLTRSINELTEIVKKHEERLAKIEDRLIKLEGRVIKLEEGVAKLEKRITRIEERLAKLEERVIKLEERVARLEERMVKLEERMAKLEKGMAYLIRRVNRIERTLERYSVSLEDEANIVVQHYLRQRGVDIKTRVTYFDGKYEFDIYGTDGKITIVGEAKVRASRNTITRLVNKVKKVMDRWPDKFKGRVITVLYCMRALPGVVEDATANGIWLIEDMEERTGLNL